MDWGFIKDGGNQLPMLIGGADASTTAAGAAIATAQAAVATTQAGIAAAAVASVLVKHYDNIPGSIEYVIDDNGEARVIIAEFDGVAVSYETPLNGLTPANMGLERVITWLKLEGYPSGMELVLDDNADARVLEWQDRDNPAAPIRYGGAGSAIANVGGGAEVFKGVSVGVAQMRTITGGGSISVFASGDNILVEDTGVAFTAPDQFVAVLGIGQSQLGSLDGIAATATDLPAGIGFSYEAGPGRLEDLSDDASLMRPTLWPALAKAFYARTGFGLILINGYNDSSSAVTASATSAANTWDVGGTLRGNLITKAAAAEAYLDAHGYCWQRGGAVCALGEQDALKIFDATITKANYKAGMAAVAAWFQATWGGKLPFVMARTAYRVPSGDNSGYQDVRAAQMELARENAAMFMGFTATLLFPTEPGFGGVHYSQDQKNRLGAGLGSVFAPLSAGVN